MLSDAQNVLGHESKEKFREESFFVAIFEKKKLTRITPCYPTWKIELFLTSCKNHRYLAGYPVSGHHRISGSGISFARLSGIRQPAENPYPAQPYSL